MTFRNVGKTGKLAINRGGPIKARPAGAETMTGAVLLLVVVTLQRWAEFHWDRSNTSRLRAAGAVEVGQRHYPFLIAVHAGWLLGLWIVGRDQPIVMPYLLLFLALQIGRYWVLWSLGRRWTTRIIVLPGAPMIACGPYRLVRHPNYMIVAGELAAVPLALDLPIYALVSLVLYAGVMALRIPAENAVLMPAAIEAEGKTS